MGKLIDVRPINPETVGIPRVHLDAASVFRCQSRVVIKSMVCVKPTIESASEGTCQTMNVLFITKPAKNHFLFVGTTISVGVLKVIYIWDTERDDSALIWVEPDRNIQAIRERCDLPRSPILVEVGQHLDRIAPRLIEWRGIRIFSRLRNPQSSLGIKSHVHRLANLWFRSHQLNFKPGWQMKFLPLLLSRQRIGFADNIIKRVRCARDDHR